MKPYTILFPKESPDLTYRFAAASNIQRRYSFGDFPPVSEYRDAFATTTGVSVDDENLI
jgi:hypothetical protein